MVGVGGPLGGIALVAQFQPGGQLWRLRYDQSKRTFTGHSDAVRSVAFAPDGRTALSGDGHYWSGSIRLWDVATGQEIRTFKDTVRNLNSVALAPDGRIALSGHHDGYAIKQWFVPTGGKIREWDYSGDVNSVAFAPDGRTALSGSDDGTLRLWDVATGR